MAKSSVLIVDDEPDIRDILKIVLEDDYEVIQAENGNQALEIIKNKSPDLILLDYKMPGLSGIEVCREIKSDILLRHLPVIMLTGKSELSDKITGIEAGADDYILKPFVPEELMARIKMVLRRTERDLDANALTKLPGNLSITEKLQEHIDRARNEPEYRFAVCYLDIDNFKSYNDRYGFERGDELIKETARILIRSVKDTRQPGDFIGHIGGDDFMVITGINRAKGLSEKIIEEFDKQVPKFYNENDRQTGFISGKNRKGEEQKFPLVSFSIGIVTNENRKIEHIAQVGEIGAELKSYAKSFNGSIVVEDKRK